MLSYLQEFSPEELEEKRMLIKKLQTQLRNEEMSLVLLKKIRQSQVLAEQAAAASAAKAAATAQASLTLGANSSVSLIKNGVTGATAASMGPSGSVKGGHHHHHHSHHHHHAPHKSSVGSTSHSGGRSSMAAITPVSSSKMPLTPDLSQLTPVNVVRGFGFDSSVNVLNLFALSANAKCPLGPKELASFPARQPG